MARGLWLRLRSFSLLYVFSFQIKIRDLHLSPSLKSSLSNKRAGSVRSGSPIELQQDLEIRHSPSRIAEIHLHHKQAASRTVLSNAMYCAGVGEHFEMNEGDVEHAPTYTRTHGHTGTFGSLYWDKWKCLQVTTHDRPVVPGGLLNFYKSKKHNWLQCNVWW